MNAGFAGAVGFFDIAIPENRNETLTRLWAYAAAPAIAEGASIWRVHQSQAATSMLAGNIVSESCRWRKPRLTRALRLMPSHGGCRRASVLVHTEQVRRIVLALDQSETSVIVME